MKTPDFKILDDLLSSYVNSGRVAGIVSAVIADDEITYQKTCGFQDKALETPMTWNSIFRIYSMTKPVTSLAAMMLWERGAFQLDDPVSKYISSFENTLVLEEDGTRRPAQNSITIRHLLCHTAGITLPAFADNHLVPLYREQKIDGMRSQGRLSDVVDRLGRLPVFFEPGSRWSYSMSTDVVGRLVEIWSGLAFEDFLQAEIFRPLGMLETAFHVKEADVDRFTTNYAAENGTLSTVIDAPEGSSFLSPPEYIAGSGGLVSTAGDYLLFMQMLINCGELKGVRIIQSDTLTLMTQNHLSGDMDDMGAADFNGVSWKGVGFGLGFNVVDDPEKAGFLGPAGEYGWTGAAGTMFFVNPVLKTGALLLTQYMPSQAYPLRAQFRDAVYKGL
ncbi:MAG: serine hydrolase domain-containing protein [Sneathiella sp.]